MTWTGSSSGVSPALMLVDPRDRLGALILGQSRHPTDRRYVVENPLRIGRLRHGKPNFARRGPAALCEGGVLPAGTLELWVLLAKARQSSHRPRAPKWHRSGSFRQRPPARYTAGRCCLPTSFCFPRDPGSHGARLRDSALVRRPRHTRRDSLPGSSTVHNCFDMRRNRCSIVYNDKPALMISFHFAGS